MDLYNHLPEKEDFKLNLIKKEHKDIYKNLKTEEKQLIGSIKNYIESKSFKWKIDKNFQFNIPPSIFEMPTTIEIPADFQHRSNKTEYSSEISINAGFSPKILKEI